MYVRVITTNGDTHCGYHQIDQLPHFDKYEGNIIGLEIVDRSYRHNGEQLYGIFTNNDLVKIIKQQPLLLNLSIAAADIGNTSDFKMLISAIGESKIKHLALKYINPNIDDLCWICWLITNHKYLRHIELSYNNIDNSFFDLLNEQQSTIDPRSKTLILDWNMVTDLPQPSIYFRKISLRNNDIKNINNINPSSIIYDIRNDFDVDAEYPHFNGNIIGKESSYGTLFTSRIKWHPDSICIVDHKAYLQFFIKCLKDPQDIIFSSKIYLPKMYTRVVIPSYEDPEIIDEIIDDSNLLFLFEIYDILSTYDHGIEQLIFECDEFSPDVAPLVLNAFNKTSLTYLNTSMFDSHVLSNMVNDNISQISISTIPTIDDNDEYHSLRLLLSHNANIVKIKGCMSCGIVEYFPEIAINIHNNHHKKMNLLDVLLNI